MKKVLVEKVKDLFTPNRFQELDVYGILEALRDESIRKLWLYEVLTELKRINLEVDTKLMKQEIMGLNNLSAKRQALQFVLESVLSVKREALRNQNHNPTTKADFDFENVTVRYAAK